MSLLQNAKLFLMGQTGLEKDALHIYVALAVFLGSCWLFKWTPRQWKPWLAVLAVALAGEAWDLRDSLVYQTPINLGGTWKDIWNTMAVPTILMLATRHSRIFSRN